VHSLRGRQIRYKTSYAEVLATARGKIPLAEVGIEAIKMRKAMTGAIILEVPGYKDRKKASTLATRLSQILDPATVRVAAPTRMAELRVVGIDVSVDKEELRDALALAAGCGDADVQVGEIVRFRYYVLDIVRLVLSRCLCYLVLRDSYCMFCFEALETVCVAVVF
jgi:hypothetical protein